MKRLGSLVLCAALLLTTGCAYAAAGSQREANAYLLYFQEADLDAAPGGDSLRTETIYLEEAETLDAQSLAAALLTELLKGPLDETLRAVAPASTTLLSVEVTGGHAQVDLSSSYGTLSGVALTLADYAITLTLTQVPEIATVGITVRGRELAYRGKQVFSPRDVLISSTEDVVGTVPAVLYFLGGDGALTAEERALDLYEGDTQVGAVVKALEQGPQSKDLQSVWPEGFRVKSAWLEEDVCYVNLPSGAVESLPVDAPLRTAVRALASSLCSLDTVAEVRFLVDGEFAEVYGNVDVSAPYTG